MSDHRTHSAHSAIDDDPIPDVPTDLIRMMSLEAGALVREAVMKLPDSESRRDFLKINAHLEKFWMEIASDEFCQQWLTVSLKTSS